jgi:fibronectin type 3 domain-containing protein
MVLAIPFFFFFQLIPLSRSESTPVELSTIHFNKEESGHNWPMEAGGPLHQRQSPNNSSGNPGYIIKTITSDKFGTGVVDRNDNVYISNKTTIFCYYPNGSIKWTIPGSLNIYALDENNYLYGQSTIGFSSFFSSNGTLRWVIPGNFFSHATIGSNGSIYLTYSYGTEKKVFGLMAIHPNSTILWNVTFPSYVSAYGPPAIDTEDNIYIVTNPKDTSIINWSFFYCFTKDGILKWSYNDTIYYGTTPTLSDDGKLFFFSPPFLISMHKDNGTIIWKKDFGLRDSWIAINNQNEVVISGIYILYPNNGTIKKIFPVSINWERENLVIDKDDNYLLYTGLGPFVQFDKNGREMFRIDFLQSSIISNIFVMRNGTIWFSWQDKVYIIGWKVPDRPKNVSIESGDEFVGLKWDAPVFDGGADILQYNIYRGLDKDNLIALTSVDNKTFSYNDTEVINGNKYFYAITARSRIGESLKTSVVTATPLSIPSAPRNLTISVKFKFNHIEWDPPEDLGGAQVLNYFIYRGTDENDLRFQYLQDPSQTFKDDGNLEYGKTYYYAVSAKNLVGESELSEIISSVVRYAPTDVLNISAISGNGFVNISWKEPMENGGSEIVRYQIFRSQGLEGNYSTLTTLSGETRYFNDTSVNNGVPYNYKIRGNNSYFDSAFSKVVTGYPATVPDVPENLNVASGDNYLEISWDPPLFNGGYAVIQYFVEKSYLSNGTFMELFEVSTLSLNDTNVTNGIGYKYRVRAMNQIGYSGFTGWIEGIPIGVPSIPIGANVKSGDGYVLLYWQMPERDEGSPILGFRIYRNGSLLEELGSNTLMFNDTTVENGKVYEYIITSFNVKGESPKIIVLYGHPRSTTVITEKHPPSAPRNLRYQLNQGKTVLNWEEPDHEGTSEIIGYLIYLKVGDIGDFKLIGRVNVRSFIDANGSVSGVYYYRVSAFNSDGEGNRTDAIRVEIKPDEREEPTHVWYYVVPAMIFIGLIIALVIFLFMRKNNKTAEGYETKLSDPITGLDIKEE